MNRTILAVILLAGTAAGTPAAAQMPVGVPGSTCASSSAMSGAMAAAGGIVSLWNGGKATAPLQISQQIQLVAQHICLQEQLIAQLKHLQASPINTAGEIQAVIARLRSLLGASDATAYEYGRAMRVYREEYPDDMTGMSTEAIIGQTDHWRTSAHRAMEESWGIQSGAVEAQRASQVRVGRQLGAVQTAPGMLAAQQGTAQLIGSLIGETQAMQSVSISHFRAVEHSLAKEQAKEERAEEMHRRAMVGLGENDKVNVRSPY
jgi:P-type conjugative transfer protein TrbJ